MSSNDPDFQAWVQLAKDADIKSVAEECGAKLRKSGGSEWTGPCPICGGKDRFNVNTRERIYLCRGSASNNGKDGGDIIAMVGHLKGYNFLESVEFITREPPPRQRTDQPAKEMDPSFGRERREEQADREIDQRSAAQRKYDDLCEKSVKFWDAGDLIPGTLAEKYLHRRGLRPLESMCENLKFVEALPYYGFASKDSDEQVELGEFPALIAAIRNVDMQIQGVHRIYIDPKAHGKLTPPGDRTRNAAKKAFGNVIGGLIWFGPVNSFAAIGEGIETSLGYWQLCSGNCTVAAAVTLGNMFGKAAGWIPHPTIKNRTMPNGVPDMDGPGMIVPKEVTEILLLGDGDSDKIYTRMCVLTAMERLTREGRRALCTFAPDGKDFNDVCREQQEDAA